MPYISEIKASIAELKKMVADLQPKTEATTTAAIPQQMVGFEPAIVGRTFGIEWKKWKATPALERKDNKST